MVPEKRGSLSHVTCLVQLRALELKRPEALGL